MRRRLTLVTACLTALMVAGCSRSTARTMPVASASKAQTSSAARLSRTPVAGSPMANMSTTAAPLVVVTSEPSTPLVPSPAVAMAASAVKVPAANYGDPNSVAAAFYVAYASYDARSDREDTWVGRIKPYTTANLWSQLSNNRPAPAAWAAKHGAGEISLVTVTHLGHPDGAPAATAAVDYVAVFANRITTTVRPPATTSTPDGKTLVLVAVSGKWLVDQLLSY